LTFLAGAFYHFGIIYYLQKEIDCEFTTIVDVDEKARKFFENQNLVDFSTIWYYRDYVKMSFNGKPDLNYLTKFEEKYKIKLWNILLADRKFYKFNRFYQFSYDEMLLILEQTAKFYEKILDKENPDFILMGLYDSHRNHLLYEICKAKKIKILMLGGTRFGYRGKISQDEKKFASNENKVILDSSTYGNDLIELRNYLKKFDHTKLQKETKTKYAKTSISKKYKALSKFFLFGPSNTSKDHFSRYGLSRSKLLSKSVGMNYKKKLIITFIEKNSIKKLEKYHSFVYYPLHSEPERALSIAAPFYTNQIEVITHIAKSLPVGYKLFVKEHPSMSLRGGSGRELSFYKEIVDLPNVELLHPSLKRDEILEKCSLVITVNGTGGFEAAFYGKPSIVMIETDYSSLSSVHTLKNLKELPLAIINSLKKSVSINDLNDYINLIDKNSFPYNKSELNSDFYSRFFDRGYVIEEKEISQNDMNDFLEKHKDTFKMLSNQFVEKISQMDKSLEDKNGR